MRYLPLNEDDRRDMLSSMGVASVDDLFRDVPEAARLDGPLDLPRHQGELEVQRHMEALAARNVAAGSVPFFVGAGAYRHHIPASVQHLIQRGEFLTAYTPYQPEISQGTLQYLFEFQTQVARLTGMDVANASMYDGSTGCGEAVLMAQRITKRRKVILSGNLHPQYADVVETVTRFTREDERVLRRAPAPQGDEDLVGLIDEDTSCVVVQNPDFFGRLQDLSGLAAAAHQAGALLIVVFTEAVSLGAIRSPGEMGADIVVGEGQSIGNALNFGGPYLGLFATRQKFVRQMPGRLCGETVDSEGRRGFVLTLSTREQHIRREKATSNICTNSGLCSLAFTIHMTLLGETGLRRLAALNHAKAVKTAETLARVPGVEVLNDSFFNEFTIRVPGSAAQAIERMAAQGVLAGVPVSRFHPDHDDLIVLAVTETNTDQDIAALARALTEVLQ
ncbi:aminomethyl-transferring glycine dehydrogenase subunit GcvPA [Iodidimonas sp. SYSU 1G8]|uniref:aminomethyl-transferring glycine dehydrogenase subunit GcvPA n=1 Tax=Iodidimonas sp. SYSU 1G8 TaxID=3133967 RepID=UPI0031FE76FD